MKLTRALGIVIWLSGMSAAWWAGHKPAVVVVPAILMLVGIGLTLANWPAGKP